MSPLGQALFLAAAVERIVEYLFAPMKKRWPEYDFWFIPYVVFVVGSLLGYFAGLDILPGLGTSPLVRDLLSAAAIGCGSELLHGLVGVLEARGETV